MYVVGDVRRVGFGTINIILRVLFFLLFLGFAEAFGFGPQPKSCKENVNLRITRRIPILIRPSTKEC